MKDLLLIVDVQNGFVNDRTKHIPSMVEKLQYEYKYVVATRFINAPDSFYRKLIHWNHLSGDTNEIELAFLPRKDAKIIDKYVYTCIDDSFLKFVKDRNISTVDICGIDTDVCVTKCAVDLFEKGIVPIVLKDYCATHASQDLQEAAIAILKRYIGAEQVV